MLSDDIEWYQPISKSTNNPLELLSRAGFHKALMFFGKPGLHPLIAPLLWCWVWIPHPVCNFVYYVITLCIHRQVPFAFRVELPVAVDVSCVAYLLVTISVNICYKYPLIIVRLCHVCPLPSTHATFLSNYGRVHMQSAWPALKVLSWLRHTKTQVCTSIHPPVYSGIPCNVNLRNHSCCSSIPSNRVYKWAHRL